MTQTSALKSFYPGLSTSATPPAPGLSSDDPQRLHTFEDSFYVPLPFFFLVLNLGLFLEADAGIYMDQY